MLELLNNMTIVVRIYEPKNYNQNDSRGYFNLMSKILQLFAKIVIPVGIAGIQFTGMCSNLAILGAWVNTNLSGTDLH
jgi:hypothetical protein